jgi:hypothetical protein
VEQPIQTAEPRISSSKPLQADILRVLLYYDLWAYPLTARQLFAFLPVNTISFETFYSTLSTGGGGADVVVFDGFYFARGRSNDIVAQRLAKERHSAKLWRWARASMHVIKRCPFVRAIFVSGDLSMNATTENSDVDFFIITEPGRLWIVRALLTLFKKIVLFNRKKFFCLNYFVSSDHLSLDEQNIYLAAEIAHLKPVYNTEMFFAYLDANRWVKDFFPNFTLDFSSLPRINNRRSYLQKFLEIPFSAIPAEKLDSYLQKKMRGIWARRYPDIDDQTRESIFRCTRFESRAYVGNFQEKVLGLYDQKLREYGVVD